ncbi:MAG TPA: CPBP family intramembrane glutamic endopeptidase [Terracidiphilus sp.]
MSENVLIPMESVQTASLEPVLAAPPPPHFPAWSWWDVLAVLGFTIFAVFAFSIIALAIAHNIPEYRRMPLTDLATDARIVVGAQATAYPLVLILIFVLARTRTHERFRDAIRWNWPGVSAPGFFVIGAILAIVVEGLSHFLPIPKSLPMDKYFHDASSAYLLAAFGLSLAPLLEELFFRGLLYPLLRRTFGLVIAVVLTATAFAGIHGAQLGYAWGPILSIFVVGVVFTVTRVRTNSVAASFLMHCGYNFALFAALWIASDHYRHLEKVAG